MTQIQITANHTKFRGQSVFRGDRVPTSTQAELTADELGVMVPRLAKIVGPTPAAPPAEPVETPAQDAVETSEPAPKDGVETPKPAKKTAKKSH